MMLLSNNRRVKVNSFRNFFECKIFIHFNLFFSKNTKIKSLVQGNKNSKKELVQELYLKA